MKPDGAPEVNLGIAFEKVVAAIQAQIDPTAVVTHNEIILDRLSQPRQFDVVVRGVFGGQKMLGVIECKDTRKKVGTPEVDGFVTKAQDINANFKILMSRRGFSKPALAKCYHYGIQALSLVSDDPINKKFFIGTRWEADITRWGQISVRLHFANEPSEPVYFNAEDLTIRGKKVLDWFTNYLLDTESEIHEFGWVVNITVKFDEPQIVSIRAGCEHLCTAISFMAERVCDKLERRVGIVELASLTGTQREQLFLQILRFSVTLCQWTLAYGSPAQIVLKSQQGFLRFA